MNCAPMPATEMYLFESIMFTVLFLCHTQSSLPKLFLIEYPKALTLELKTLLRFRGESIPHHHFPEYLKS